MRAVINIARHLFCISGLLLMSLTGRAQYEVSSGFDLTYPLLLNSNNSQINYSQISFGIKFGIAYKPIDIQFFPMFTAAFGRTRLPLKEFGKSKNVATLNFNYLNLMINENYVLTLPTSEVFIYGGIGVSCLFPQGPHIAGPGGGTMRMTIDSSANVNKAFPAMNLGFEYNYGASTGKDLYLTMGLNFQYILLLDQRNTYYITVREPGLVVNKYTTSLTGSVISPGFYLAIHYMLKGKKSGMYMK